MILTVDVGNTHTVIGLYQGKKLTHHWRILTEAERTADEYGVLLHSLFSTSELVFSSVQGIAVSCVVPPMTNVMEELMHKYFRISPLMVGPGIKTGMPILYDSPREVGARMRAGEFISLCAQSRDDALAVNQSLGAAE